MCIAVGAALAVAAVAGPVLAAGASASATFTAYDYGWTENGKAGSTRAVISPGGTVGFSYPTGRSEHNADFRGGPLPAACRQTAGAAGGSAPPLPHVPTGAGWTGTCAFHDAGVYKFHCDLHTFMTGTVVVVAPGSPLAGNPRHDVSFASRQRGTSVRGTIRLSGAAAGGRLEVDLRMGGRRVGRLLRSDLQPGKARFSVPVDARAKRVLRRQGRIALTLRVAVRALDGTRQAVIGGVQLSAA